MQMSLRLGLNLISSVKLRYEEQHTVMKDDMAGIIEMRNVVVYRLGSAQARSEQTCVTFDIVPPRDVYITFYVHWDL